MGILTDRLDQMRVAAVAPGGRVRARLSGRGDVTVSLEPGYYQNTTEADLEQRLTALATLLWVERTREYRRAMLAAFTNPALEERPPRDTRDVAFRQARDTLVVEGRSPDGRIILTVRGVRDWRVHVAPGTLRALDEDAFVEGLRIAAAGLINDLTQQIRALKAQIFS